MSASKSRPRWAELPEHVRQTVEDLVGRRVTTAESCPGGFSPGFASKLTLDGGRRVFVKAIDAAAWPSQATMYRDEEQVAAQLPPTVPAPRLIGSANDGRWIVLSFECVDGSEPPRPWRPADIARVVAALGAMTAAVTPSPVAVPHDQPRIGGWVRLAGCAALRARLPADCAWVAARLGELVTIERDGLAAARGDSLVHFDAFPHNILLAADRVVLVDWPHARLGAPCIDLLTVLATASGDGLDPEPLLAQQPIAEQAGSHQLTTVLAALTGFWLAGAVEFVEQGLEPIAAAKLDYARGGLRWLRRRLADRG